MKTLHDHLLKKHGLDLTNEELKKIQKICRVKPKFEFKEALIAYGFKESAVNEWMEIRRIRKAIDSENAFKRFIKQVELTKMDIHELLDYIIERQWRAYNHKWMKDTKPNGRNEQPKDVNDLWK